MVERPLSEREPEVLIFLLSAPGIPDVDAFRRQAEVAVSSGRSCPYGCASIGLEVDHSAAPQEKGSVVPPEGAGPQTAMLSEYGSAGERSLPGLRVAYRERL